MRRTAPSSFPASNPGGHTKAPWGSTSVTPPHHGSGSSIANSWKGSHPAYNGSRTTGRGTIRSTCWSVLHKVSLSSVQPLQVHSLNSPPQRTSRHQRLQHPRLRRRSHRHHRALPYHLHPPPLFKSRTIPARRHLEQAHLPRGHARSDHAHPRHPRARWDRPPPRAPCTRLSHARAVPQSAPSDRRTRVVRVR